MLFNHCRQLAVPGDLVSWSPGQQSLTDEGQFVLLHVLERKLFADAKGSAIHEVNRFASFVLDGEVVAPGKQLLLHHVTHNGGWHCRPTAHKLGSQQVPCRQAIPPRAACSLAFTIAADHKSPMVTGPDDRFDRNRFVQAQEEIYPRALAELKLGREAQPLDVVHLSAG
jgi:hypothetical protein